MKIKKTSKKDMTVSVLGLGYIGLPTALLLAEKNVRVFGFDISLEKKELLQSGKLPFDEKGLTELFDTVKTKKKFDISDKVMSADYYLISVPTPQVNGRADLIYIKQALESIEPIFQPDQTIIIESTIGPRDCVDVLIPLVKEWEKPFHLAHCPERAIPGNTLFEMVNNDRIIGGDTPASAKIVAELYSQFVKGPIHITNTIAAASCKVMENTYRAVNIALANEFAQLAEELDFNVWEAITLANKHPRVNIHQPGPGVGGHCIPIDPWFFVGNSTKAVLIETALKKNEEMSEYIFKEIQALLTLHSISKPVIVLLGYAYKKNVDDFRETPAEPLRKILSEKNTVLVSDPFVKTKLITTEKDALSKADVLVLTTDHDHYKELDLTKYPNVKLIYDTRNCFTEKQLSSFTGIYKVLGKKVG
ncbi:N/A [soil metagenome]